jgi:hypothetical protein
MPLLKFQAMFTPNGIKKKKVNQAKYLGTTNSLHIKKLTQNLPQNMSVVLLKVTYQATSKKKPML